MFPQLQQRPGPYLFTDIKHFCTESGLKINDAKTQLIVFKPPRRQLPPSFEVNLGSIVLKPLQSVKLLGVHLDQHLTMAVHIDKICKKCHGLLGALGRAASCLPEGLLKLAYTALIRTHLEYASAILCMASDTQLRKLDLIQKAAARVITGYPRLAHSDPLLNKLHLQSLRTRRIQHVRSIADSILADKCHPALSNLLTFSDVNCIFTDFKPRTTAGRKCFSVLAAHLCSADQNND